jgi:hypothetical protein
MIIQKVQKLKLPNGEENTMTLLLTQKDGTITAVPKTEDNTDYQNILSWVEEGNTIEEAD